LEERDHLRDTGSCRGDIIKKDLKLFEDKLFGHYFNFLPHREHGLLYKDLSELVSHRKIIAVCFENYTKHTYSLNEVHIFGTFSNYWALSD